MGFVPDKQSTGRFVPDSASSNVATEEQPQESPNVGVDVLRGSASGLIKGGANMLDTAQQVSDIITRPIRVTNVSVNKKASLREKILGQNIKLEVIPNAVQAFSNQAEMARKFADESLKPETLAGKVAEVGMQAPAFIAETAALTPSGMAGKIALLPKVRVGAQTIGLGGLGLIQGSEEGKIGGKSLQQSASNIVMGKIFEGIGRISPSPASNMATKIMATVTRGVAGAGVGGATSLVSGGVYDQDPDRADRLIVDSMASAIMTALPTAKPKNIAKEIDNLNINREKLTNEFLGNVKSEFEKLSDINLTESYGIERPATKMFSEIFNKPLKTFRQVIKAVESNIQSVQAEKASKIINSEKNIQSDPTLGLKGLLNSEVTNPGGSNPAAASKLAEILAVEKAKVGNNMKVSDAWKRQSELKFELNDDAMKMQNRVPLTRLQKMANEMLIRDYNRAIGEVEPSFRKLSSKETTLITLKDLISNKSGTYQKSTKSTMNISNVIKDIPIRSNPFLSAIQGIKNFTYDVINRVSPVEGTMRRIVDIQKRIDKLSSLQAKKINAEEEMSRVGGEVSRIYNPNFTMGASTSESTVAGRPVRSPLQIGMRERLMLEGPRNEPFNRGTAREDILQRPNFEIGGRRLLEGPQPKQPYPSLNRSTARENISASARRDFELVGERKLLEGPKPTELKYEPVQEPIIERIKKSDIKRSKTAFRKRSKSQ